MLACSCVYSGHLWCFMVKKPSARVAYVRSGTAGGYVRLMPFPRYPPPFVVFPRVIEQQQQQFQYAPATPTSSFPQGFAAQQPAQGAPQQQVCTVYFFWYSETYVFRCQFLTQLRIVARERRATDEDCWIRVNSFPYKTCREPFRFVQGRRDLRWLFCILIPLFFFWGVFQRGTTCWCNCIFPLIRPLLPLRRLSSRS